MEGVEGEKVEAAHLKPVLEVGQERVLGVHVLVHRHHLERGGGGCRTCMSEPTSLPSFNACRWFNQSRTQTRTHPDLVPLPLRLEEGHDPRVSASSRRRVGRQAEKQDASWAVAPRSILLVLVAPAAAVKAPALDVGAGGHGGCSAGPSQDGIQRGGVPEAAIVGGRAAIVRHGSCLLMIGCVCIDGGDK